MLEAFDGLLCEGQDAPTVVRVFDDATRFAEQLRMLSEGLLRDGRALVVTVGEEYRVLVVPSSEDADEVAARVEGRVLRTTDEILTFADTLDPTP